MTKNENESDDENDDEEYSFEQLPDKCEKNINVDKQTPQGITTGSEVIQVEENKPSVPALAIPKLDLTKARQIMELNAKKSTQQYLMKEAQQGNIQLYLEKIKKLEKEIDMSRRNLSREMLLNKTLSIQTESLKRENEELESRNEILINSHNMFEEKWTKIVNAFEFYKDFYKKHQEMLSSRKSPTSPNRSILHSDNENSYDADRIQKIKSQQGNLCLSQISKFPLSIQKSLMQMNNEDFRFEQGKRQQQLMVDGAYSRNDAQGYMIQMAKDLYQQFEKTNADKIFIENQISESNNDAALVKSKYTSSGRARAPRLKRCFSNTLDYVNQQKIQDEMQDILERQKKQYNFEIEKSDIDFKQFINLPKAISEIKLPLKCN